MERWYQGQTLLARTSIHMKNRRYPPDDIFVPSAEEAKSVERHFELGTGADQGRRARLEAAVPGELDGHHLLLVEGNGAASNARISLGVDIS
jgi:hypothetical protein